MLEILARFAIYACSVFVCCHYVNSYWVVGPVFGLAVICWDSKNFRNFAAGRHIAFLAASSLVYALVYGISSQNWNHGSDIADSLYGSLPIAIVTGSILLPAAHKALLKASAGAAIRTSLLLIASYYLIAFFSLANDSFAWGFSLNFLLLSLGVWQAVYLYSFSILNKKG